jgi:hypothetical protein
LAFHVKRSPWPVGAVGGSNGLERSMRAAACASPEADAERRHQLASGAPELAGGACDRRRV